MPNNQDEVLTLYLSQVTLMSYVITTNVKDLKFSVQYKVFFLFS